MREELLLKLQLEAKKRHEGKNREFYLSQKRKPRLANVIISKIKKYKKGEISKSFLEKQKRIKMIASEIIGNSNSIL